MKAALAALTEGADPNARDELPQHLSLWRLILDELRGKRHAPSTAPTALIMALEGSAPHHPVNPTLVKALLDHGAKVNAQDSNGATPLLLAVHKGYTTTAQMLLAHGADANRPDASGMTPLMFALLADPGILSCLLDHGAKVNLRDLDGWTALNYAVTIGNMEGIKRLLDSGADINDKDKYGNPILWGVLTVRKDSKGK